jgi:hypothetical protein
MADTYKIEPITPENHQRRAVAFLISEDARVNSKVSFDRLDENTKRTFQTKFDFWLSGKPYWRGYHGWDKSQYQGKYTHCLVFTSREDRTAQRFYGFLCNPKRSDPRYCVCILVRYAPKTRHETDETDLKIVEEIRTLPAVQEVVSNHFKEKL